jgi:hypothetical protein
MTKTKITSVHPELKDAKLNLEGDIYTATSYSSSQVEKFYKKYGGYDYSPRLFLGFYFINELAINHTEKNWRIDDTYINRFFRYEKHLTNPELFWGVSGAIWKIGGQNDERWLDAFARDNRLDVKFNRRVELWCDPYENTPIDYVQDYFQKRGSKTDITIYRGFQIKHGKAVRRGVKKVDNENAYFQDEGSGFSYSLSKTIAGAFPSAHLNPYHYSQFLGITDKKKIRQLRTKIYDTHDNLGTPNTNTAGQLMQEEMIGFGTYSALGIYKIKKKDIINVGFAGREEEVVVDPHGAKLQKYQFLTFADGCAFSAMQSSADHWFENIPSKFFWHRQPEDKIYKLFKKLSKGYYDQPEVIKKVLTGSRIGGKRFKDLMHMIEDNIVLDPKRALIEVDPRKVSVFNEYTGKIRTRGS